MGILTSKWFWIGLLIAGLAAFGQYERWQKERYQAIVAADEERIKALGVEIATQNAAVDQLKADGDKAMAKAEAGLKAVQARVGSLQAEADRLGRQAASAKPTTRPSGCPPSGADQAVQTIREGLSR